jgi:hypothetical protein
MRDIMKIFMRDGFTRQKNDEDLAPVCIDIGRGMPEPGHILFRVICHRLSLFFVKP